MSIEGGVSVTEKGFNKVRVLNKDYAPSPEAGTGKYEHVFREPRENCGVIILPGWPGRADQKNVGPWAQAYADELGVPTTVLTTTARWWPSPRAEVRAVADYIKEHHLDQVVLIGQSFGAKRAPEVANALRGDEEGVEVRGIFEINPGGAYRQKLTELGRNTKLEPGIKSKLIKEKMEEAPREKAKGPDEVPTEELVEKISEQEKTDMNEGMDEKSHGVWPLKTPLKIIRSISEVLELVYPNKAWSEVTEPVVVALSQHDPLFSNERMGLELRPDGEKGILTERGMQWRRLLQMPESDKGERNVKVIIGERLASHVGLYMYRPKGLAKATLALLDRVWRERERSKEAQPPTTSA